MRQLLPADCGRKIAEAWRSVEQEAAPRMDRGPLSWRQSIWRQSRDASSGPLTTTNVAASSLSFGSRHFCPPTNQQGLLEPDVGKLARPDLRVAGHSNVPGLPADRRSSWCVRTCVPTPTETPIERGSLSRRDGQGDNRGNGSGSRASPGRRPGAALPRVRGPLDQADRRSSRSVFGDGQGVLLRPV